MELYSLGFFGLFKRGGQGNIGSIEGGIYKFSSFPFSNRETWSYSDSLDSSFVSFFFLLLLLVFSSCWLFSPVISYHIISVPSFQNLCASNMVLTDRQREDLHAGIYEYLKSRPEFQSAATAFAEADAKAASKTTNNVGKTPLLEKKWTAIPRLQKKVLELERVLAQNAKIHAHRTGQTDATTAANGAPARRMLPRLPCSHTLQGHSAVITSAQVHPVFTVVVSGSEDGTIKVRWL